MVGTALIKHIAHLQAEGDEDIAVSVSWGGSEVEDIQGTVVSAYPDGLVIRSLGDKAMIFAPFGSGAVFIIHDP